MSTTHDETSNQNNISACTSMESTSRSNSDIDSLEEGRKNTQPEATVAPEPLRLSQHKFTPPEDSNESTIERMTREAEERKANRVLVIFPVRKLLLTRCRAISEEKGYNGSFITYADLLEFREETQEKVNAVADNKSITCISNLKEKIGFRKEADNLLRVLDRAIEVVDSERQGDDAWFHYQDFSFYHTKVESRWPWMRNEFRIALVIIFIYYLITTVFFCKILATDGVCPVDPTDQNRSYYGWVSALYFASSSLSGVGYGDVSVQQSGGARTIVAIFYIFMSNYVGISALSAAAGNANFLNMGPIYEKTLQKIIGKQPKTAFLYRKVRRYKFVRYLDIATQFFVLNLIGMFIAQIYGAFATDEQYKWTWMTAFYWAVQTTTTMGYGDVPMSFQFRYFQIPFLVIATYFVGNTIGRIGAINDEVLEIRRLHAWDRRQITKTLMEDMQGDVHDDEVDQYEFTIASLVALGKLSSDDMEPIMEKFRTWADETGYITINSIKQEDHGRLEDGAIETVLVEDD